MNRETPKLVVRDGEGSIEGNFTFDISPTLYQARNLTPINKISFDWSPELNQEDAMAVGHDKVIEMFAEKLKQDFINLNKQKDE